MSLTITQRVEGKQQELQQLVNNYESLRAELDVTKNAINQAKGAIDALTALAEEEAAQYAKVDDIVDKIKHGVEEESSAVEPTAPTPKRKRVSAA